jgi:hypothetical protein
MALGASRRPQGRQENQTALSDRLTGLAGCPVMRFAGEGSIDTAVVTVGRSRVRCRSKSAVWFQGQAERPPKGQNASTDAPPTRSVASSGPDRPRDADRRCPLPVRPRHGFCSC